jgi:short-subunit dehydrogenase
MPTMMHQGESHVLNVASILGLVGLARVSAYSTTKFGLVGFSESLRHECGRMGVGVTALCPGLVDTKLFTSAPRGKDVKASKTPPSIVLITPEKVAKRAVRAIYRNQPLVVMQTTSWMIWLTKRYAPWLLDMVHRLRRQRQAPEKNRPAIVAPKQWPPQQQAEPAKKRAA